MREIFSAQIRNEWNCRRVLRRVKEGTSSVLVQSGLQESWWAEAMGCYCYLRNAQHLLADGQTPHERRFNALFGGPIIPFGAEVKFYPISAKYQGRVHQFGAKVLPRIFMGYAFNAGGSWTGDLWIVDTEGLETMPPSGINVQKSNQKRWTFLK